MTVEKAVAINIRERLVRRDMTQGQLATAAGMTPTALSARLRGEREFRLSELHAISEALGVRLADLMPDKEER